MGADPKNQRDSRMEIGAQIIRLRDLIQKEQDLTKANQQISQQLSTMLEVGHYKETKKNALQTAKDHSNKALHAKERTQNPKLVARAPGKAETRPVAQEPTSLPRVSNLALGKR